MDMHQKKYEEMIKNGRQLKICSVRFISHGIPRSGKTTFWRRLIDPSYKMKEVEPITGVAKEQKPVVIKDAKIGSNMVTSGEWLELDEGGYANMLLQMFSEMNTTDRLPSHADIVSSDVSTPPPDIHVSITSIASTSTPSTATPSSTEDSISESFRFLTEKASESQWKQVKLNLENIILLSCADTGGHAEFLDMHAALVNGPSFHLLFSRLDQDLDKCFPVYYTDEQGKPSPVVDSDLTMKEVIFQIFASIKCLGNFHSDGTKTSEVEKIMKQLKSKVMFVGTYADKLKETGSTFEDKDVKLIQMLRKEQGEICDPVMYAVNDRSKEQLMLKVNNKEGGISEILEIRSNLMKKITDNFDKIPIPASWFVLALLIRDHEDPMMTFNDCAKKAKKVMVGEEELKSVLWFLHHGLGIILYYQDKVFKVEAVYKSVTKLIEKFYIVGCARDDQSVKAFKNFGIFSLEVAKKEKSPKGFIPPVELVPLLDHLNIITQAPNVLSSKIEDPYFMPCALKCYRSKDKPLYEAVDGNPEPLKLFFDSHFTPMGIFPALIKVLFSENGWKIPIKKPILFKNKVRFLVQEQNVYIMSYLCYFEIAMEADDPRETNFESLCHTVRKDFEEALNKVIENTKFHFLKDYQYAFQCKSMKCTNKCSDHLAVFKLKDITCIGGSMECFEDDSIRIKFNDRQRLWFSICKS